MDEKIKSGHSSKSQSLYKEIRNKICLLEYAPGAMLREEALAKEYGVSRTPIRQVLQRLEYDGLVVSQSGSGVIVTTVDIRFLKEVYAVRLKIAEFVGEMMTSHFPEADILALEEILTQVKPLRQQYNSYELGRLYHQFNEIMTQNISNRPLQQMYDQLFHQTARVWLELLPDFDWEEEVDIMCEEIADVISALREGDMIAVGEVRRDHMIRLLQRINSYLGSANQRERR
jgi:DNA-binding GntR family transcriptional regulator